MTFNVTLRNQDGLTFSLTVPASCDAEACRIAQINANLDQQHTAYGPWEAASSRRNT